ncbi:hypothetical protein [uncultured Enterovirga sp.]
MTTLAILLGLKRPAYDDTFYERERARNLARVRALIAEISARH